MDSDTGIGYGCVSKRQTPSTEILGYLCPNSESKVCLGTGHEHLFVLYWTTIEDNMVNDPQMYLKSNGIMKII